MHLLAYSADAKSKKGLDYGIATGMLYLTPERGYDGRTNLCPFASPRCAAACLYTAGRGVMEPVEAGRRRKTKMYLEDRERFVRELTKDVKSVERRALKNGMIPSIRLNGTSDIPFESMEWSRAMMREHPAIHWYDYTKNPNRMLAWIGGEAPANYHLTFSRSETNAKDCLNVLHMGGNVAVVFHQDLHETIVERGRFAGHRVINGDEHDARFTDPRAQVGWSGYIVALKAKGKARKDFGGFVITDLEGGL